MLKFSLTIFFVNTEGVVKWGLPVPVLHVVVAWAAEDVVGQEVGYEDLGALHFGSEDDLDP